MGRFQRRANLRLTQMCVGLRRQGDAHPDHRISYVLAGDGADHRSRGVDVLGFHRYVHRDEIPGFQLMELEIGHPPALGLGRVKVHDAKSFFVAFLAKVHPLQASRVDHHGRVETQDLMFVDVTQCDVFDLRPVQRADQKHVVLSQHHGAFRADGGAIHRYMPGEDRRHIRVQFLGRSLDPFGQPLFQGLPHLFDRQTTGFLTAEDGAAPWPRNGQDLQRPRRRGHVVRLQIGAHVDIGDFQSGKDVHRRGPAGSRGQVVVTHQQKNWDPGAGQTVQPFGEFPLVGLGRVPALVGVAGQQHQINAFVQGKLHNLVQGIEKISQPGG